MRSSHAFPIAAGFVPAAQLGLARHDCIAPPPSQWPPPSPHAAIEIGMPFSRPLLPPWTANDETACFWTPAVCCRLCCLAVEGASRATRLTTRAEAAERNFLRCGHAQPLPAGASGMHGMNRYTSLYSTTLPSTRYGTTPGPPCVQNRPGLPRPALHIISTRRYDRLRHPKPSSRSRRSKSAPKRQVLQHPSIPASTADIATATVAACYCAHRRCLWRAEPLALGSRSEAIETPANKEKELTPPPLRGTMIDAHQGLT